MTKTNVCFKSRVGTSYGIGSMDILREGTEEQRNGLYEKELPVEMFYRDVRLYRIFEGISEIQRVVIAKNLLK